MSMGMSMLSRGGLISPPRSYGEGSGVGLFGATKV
jgi:hypothetical protein